MSNRHHKPLLPSSPAIPNTLNLRFGQLDSAIETIVNGGLFSDTVETLIINDGSVIQTAGRHVIASASGSAADLETIIPVTSAQLLMIKAATGDVITIKHNVGNIFLGYGEDMSIMLNQTLLLYWVGDVWTNIGSPQTDDVKAANVGYQPADLTDWANGDPGDLGDAFDVLIQRMAPAGYIAGMSGGLISGNHERVSPGACMDDTNTVMIRVDSETTINMATTGINALDTGTFSADTMYYLWACKGTSGTGYVVSLSNSAPTLPAGYDDNKRLLGGWFTTSTRLADKSCEGESADNPIGAHRFYYYMESTNSTRFTAATAINVAQSPAWTTIDCSTWCPSTATTVLVHIRKSLSAGAALYIAKSPTDGKWLLDNANNGYGWTVKVPLHTDQSFVLQGSGTGDEDLWIYVLGYGESL